MVLGKRCVDIYCIRMYNKDVDLHTSCKLDFQNLRFESNVNSQRYKTAKCDEVTGDQFESNVNSQRYKTELPDKMLDIGV